MSMRLCVLSFLVTLFLVTALGGGCTITLGDGSTLLDDDSGAGAGAGPAAGSGEAPRLPEPTTWRVEPPQLTPEQQQRQGEVDQLVIEQYGDYRIVETTQGYSGDIVDWVDSATIPGAFLTPPPPTWTPEDLQPPLGAELARTELALYPELRGPDGTTPIHRPDFSAYVMGLTGATSLQDYLDNYQVGGQPSDRNRLYAGLISPFPNMGVSGTINSFQGEIEEGTFSVIELAVSCPLVGDMVEMIGVVISRDRANDFGNDGKQRLHVEYMTQGGGAGYAGNRKGGWDERQIGFIPQPGRPYGPGGIVLASTPGLGTQKENRIDVFQNSSGDWWIAHNGNLLGHYPADLFHMLNGGACRAQWYGEVYDPTPADWTWNDLGRGEFSTAGYGYASYVRDVTFRDLLFARQYPLDDELGSFSMYPTDPACYTRSLLTIAPPPWDHFFYLDGPGGDAPGCD